LEDPSLSYLDSGEAAAILIAQSESEALLLIDEAAGRKAASLRGIANTGTLGILRAAAYKGHLDIRSALSRLKETNFRISQLLIDELLTEHERRTPPQPPAD
jgi:predicted nucleic acid-binding protein